MQTNTDMSKWYFQKAVSNVKKERMHLIISNVMFSKSIQPSAAAKFIENQMALLKRKTSNKMDVTVSLAAKKLDS